MKAPLIFIITATILFCPQSFLIDSGIKHTEYRESECIDTDCVAYSSKFNFNIMEKGIL